MRILSKLIFFSFFYSYGLAQEPKLVLPVGHTDNVTTAQFSPDGRTVLTASTDKSVKLWDVRTGALLVDLPNRNDGSTQFSPDGSKILTIGAGCKLFETKTGELIKSYSGDNYAYGINTFYSANFSKDGKMIVTTSDNDNAEIWDVESEALLAVLEGHTYDVNYAEFSPDGQKIVTASWDSTVRIWDAKSRRTLFILNLGHFVQLAKFSPDGQKVATISIDTIVKIWDVATGKLIANLAGHTNYPENFAFSADSKRIVTASGDGTAKIWDAESGKLVTDFVGHFGVVNSVCFSPDGRQLLTASNDGGVIVWDANTGKDILKIYNHSLPVNSASFSADGKRILTASNDNTAAIWDISTQKLETRFAGRTMTPVETVFSPVGAKILTGYNDGIARVLDYSTGKLVLSLNAHKSGIASVEYNHDGTRILTASFDSTVKIWNALTGKLLFTLKGFKGAVYSASFSWDGRKIVTASEDSTVKLWDTKTGKLLTSKKQKSGISGAKFFPDGKAVISFSGGWDDSTRVWDISTGFFRPYLNKKVLRGIPSVRARNIKFSPEGNRMMAILNTAKVLIVDLNDESSIELELSFDEYDASFSPDGRKIIITGKTGNVSRIFNSYTGQHFFYYHTSYGEQHQDIIYSACFSPDATITATASRDNTVRVWDAVSGELIYTYLVTSGTDYLLREESGYYFSTPGASKMLYYVTKNLGVISFDQLDVKYNRPDKVLEAIGNTDTALINSYKRAYHKRIKKLGIDTTQFKDGYSVPEADFESRDRIEYDQKNEQLTLRIKGVDTTYTLDHFNIWINEVPIFGMKGIRIKSRNSNYFDTTITIHLSQGENRIETSVTNVNGTESYRMPLYVKYTAAQPVKEKVHFIGIGINQFADSRRNLQWCVKDIRDMALKFKEKYGEDIVIDTLFDQNVTLSKVQALKQKLLKTNINYKVIIAYSGHGLLSKQYDYYLSSYSVNFKNPEENGIAYEEIENLLDNIPARKKLLLLDACHSGEVDKDEMLAIQNSKNKAGNKGLIINRGSEDEGGNETTTKTVGLQNSFELMQSLFVNVGKGTGATIISAAGGVQFAQERDDLENGVFTFSLLEVLAKHKTIKVSQLKKIVGERVEQLTNGLQKPTARNELKDFDWEVW